MVAYGSSSTSPSYSNTTEEVSVAEIQAMLASTSTAFTRGIITSSLAGIITTGLETGLYSVIQLPCDQVDTVRGTQLCLPQSFCVDFFRRFQRVDLLELVRCNTSPEVEKHSKKVKKLNTKTLTSMQWDLLNDADVDWIGGMSKYFAIELEALCVTQRGFEPGVPFLPLTWVTKDVLSFVKQSSTTLRTLFLDKIPISSSELLAMLECVPQLTMFRFNEVPLASCEGAITDEILLRMTTKNKNPRNRRTVIVPALHTLLLVCSGQNFTDEIFGQMVIGRLAQPDDLPAIAKVWLDVTDRRIGHSHYMDAMVSLTRSGFPAVLLDLAGSVDEEFLSEIDDADM